MNLALPQSNKLLVKQMMSAIPQTLHRLSVNRFWLIETIGLPNVASIAEHFGVTLF